MAIQTTSIQAWEEIKDNLGPKRKAVYEALRQLGIANDKMIAKFLSWPINTVTPRRGELTDLKLVGVAFTGPDLNTGRKTIYWRCVK